MCEIMTRRTVEAVEGEAGRFRVRLTKAPRFIDLDQVHRAAGTAPMSAPSPSRPTSTKASTPARPSTATFPRPFPRGFAIDKLGTSPCKAACPTHISVQGYVALIAAGKYKEALKLIKQDNPFPIVCGRVCNHPCEEACKRGEVDAADRHHAPEALRGRSRSE